jgi:hypothetical protein
MEVAMLTTVDNPHSPFDEWDAWFAWDMQAGYNTSGMLARIVVVSNEVSDYDYILMTNQAIDEIVKENVLGVFKKVTREFPLPED